MNLAYKAYKAVSSSLFLALFPPFWCYARISGRYQQSMKQRLGFYPDRLVRNISGAPRVWIHAVSVGEVRVAVAILDALSECLPDAARILSTGTEQGQAVARESADRNVTCLYAPFDFILSWAEDGAIIKANRSWLLKEKKRLQKNVDELKREERNTKARIRNAKRLNHD